MNGSDYWTGGAATISDPAPSSNTSHQAKQLDFGAPLDAQLGVWPSLSVPDKLKPHLFPEDGRRTYAILDAGVLQGLPEMLDASGLEFGCLYDGALAEELRDFAPYLVALKSDDPLTRRLLTDGTASTAWWPYDYGLFAISNAGFAEIRRHFRKFTSVQSEQAGQRVYLRFWNSATMVAMARFPQEDGLISALLAEHVLLFRDFSDLQGPTLFSLQGTTRSDLQGLPQ